MGNPQRELRWLLYVVTFVMLSACADGAREVSKRNTGANVFSAIPFALAPQHPQITNITARLQMDGLEFIPLSLNWKQAEARGLQTQLTAGLHDFVILYEANTTHGTTVILAQAQQQLDISDSAQATLVFNKWTYADDDDDGYTNLAEWQLGTDWLDAGVTPPRESMRVSGNYLFTDQVALDPISGFTGNGSSNSYNIEASHGDQLDF